ncbi:MAG TPA: PAS domain S-box protein [Burkholderiales bacterium]|nr:PAS domain S-box protein [Burkholderiales bacterium]
MAADPKDVRRRAAARSSRGRPTHVGKRDLRARDRHVQFELVQEALGIATWIWDLAPDLVRWYGDASRLLGLPPGRFSGRFADYLARLHPEDAEKAKQLYIDCMKGRSPEYRAEERVIWPDGSVHWLETYGRAEYGADGRATRMAGVIKDISAAKRQESARVRAERLLAHVFDASPEFITVVRASDGAFVAANAAFERMTGYGAEETRGRTVDELRLWADPVARERFRADLRRDGAVYERPMMLRRRDGAVVPGMLSASLVEHEGERLTVSVVHDISERKRHEAMLMNIARGVSAELGDAFFQSLVEHLARELEADFAFIAKLTYPDRGRLRTLAFVADGASAPNFEYAVEGSPCATGLERRGTVIYPARVAEQFPRDGGLQRLGIQGYIGSGLHAADGSAIGVLVVMHRKPIERAQLWSSMIEIFAARAAAEIERARAERLVRRTNETLEQTVRERTAELQDANRDLESFNYSISHDLRQPLNAITGFAELLRDAGAGTSARRRQEFVREIETNAARMEGMIGALMQMARAGRGPLEKTQVDMRAVVDSVLRELGASEALDAIVEVGDLPPALGDAVLLRQVWSNLIGNALKYSREQAAPRVRIWGVRCGEGIEYAVSDNGVGFDMRHAERLFEAFQRLPSAASFEGNGVGLAIVQRIVRRHGGRLTPEAVPGQGATFRFTLPA